MWALRNFFFYLFIVPTTMMAYIAGLISLPLSEKSRYYIVTRWSYLFIWWSKICCGIDYNIKGIENIPKESFIAISNHQSLWETIFMQMILPKQSWVIKKELLYIPFFGWALAILKPIAVTRSNQLSVRKILREGKERLATNQCLLIYPEGTRTPPGAYKKYTRTAAALAIANRSIILPIAHNSGNFWPRGPFFKQPGTISLVIGEPIPTKENDDPAELTSRVENWINKTKMNMHPPG